MPTSDAILRYLEAKFDYGYFILIYSFRSHDATQKISGHFDQNEGVTAFFVISHFHKIRKLKKLLVCVGIYGYVLLCMDMFWSLMCPNNYPLGLVH